MEPQFKQPEPEPEKVILTKKPRKPRTTANSTTLLTSYVVPHDKNNDNDNDNDNGSHAMTHTYEVGVDEAGRGPLFGRVYTAAVILPSANNQDLSSGFDFSLLKDSKKFSSDKKIREASD